MSSTRLSQLARRKLLITVYVALFGLVLYLSLGTSKTSRAASLYPYLWPSTLSSSHSPGGAPLRSASDDSLLLGWSKDKADKDSTRLGGSRKGDWTTFHQHSSIRHGKHGTSEGVPLASDGALSGKGHRASLRTNLRDDMLYFTTFPIWGYTNQFACIFTSIYMAMLAGRVPILQPLIPHPSQLGGPAKYMPIGEVYDLARLRAVLDTPIVEMWELKGSPVVEPLNSEPSIEEEPLEDEIGCWSAWWPTYGPGYNTNDAYRFKAAWTPIPEDFLAGTLQHDMLQTVSLLRPRGKSQFVLPAGSQAALDRHNMTLNPIIPDDHVACLDIAMFMLVEPGRWDVTNHWVAGDGAWQAVGRHMRFQPKLLDLAEQYLKRTFAVADGQSIPPYIAVHIRRTDFSDTWKALGLREYAHATWVLRENIRKYLGVTVSNIVVLTDETDPEWLAQVKAYNGMVVMDHLEPKTLETHGAWYPTLLDTVFMSGGIGLVGLHQSSMAILASHRVTEWNAGVSKLIHADYGDEVPDDWVWPLNVL